MRCGFGRSDITPQTAVTLSGFVARCNVPFEKVRDSLHVSALYLEEQGGGVLIVTYDLLGIGPDLLTRLNAAIDQHWAGRIPTSRRIFCATHNHSGPATITLLGCGVADEAYWNLLIERTLAAIAQAVERLVEARIGYDLITVAGLNYNRRKVLEDGSVVMAQFPDKPVVREGPPWNDFLFLKAETLDGRPIAGVINWAAHPCTVCTREVTAEFPGELTRRLERRDGFPFIFLQGACANINLPFHDMSYDEMLRNVDAIERKLPSPRWKAAGAGLRMRSDTITLSYKKSYTRAELEKVREGMGRIADTGTGQKEHIAILANILNVPPDRTPDPVMLRYIAGTLKAWSERLLAQPTLSGEQGCPLAVSVVSIGELMLVFTAAEVFTETALKLRAMMPGRVLGIVGYTSPLVGYLPPDDALGEGGYEVDHAWRFYGHPAVYAPGSEEKLIRAVATLISTTHSSR